MFTIEQKNYGFKLVLAGSVNLDEVTAWFAKSKVALESAKKDFCVFIDMRSVFPLDKESQTLLAEGQAYFHSKGLLRSIVILSSPVITMQFRAIAGQSGIYANERYIDASAEPNWEKIGMEWLVKGIEPTEHKFEVTKSNL